MSLRGNDAALLLGAAVSTGIQYKAPKRTTTGIAAAVAGALARPCPASAKHVSFPREPAGNHVRADKELDVAGDDELLAALRSRRRARRLKKKERRKLAKAAAIPPEVPSPAEGSIAARRGAALNASVTSEPVDAQSMLPPSRLPRPHNLAAPSSVADSSMTIYAGHGGPGTFDHAGDEVGHKAFSVCSHTASSPALSQCSASDAGVSRSASAVSLAPAPSLANTAATRRYNPLL